MMVMVMVMGGVRRLESNCLQRNRFRHIGVFGNVINGVGPEVFHYLRFAGRGPENFNLINGCRVTEADLLPQRVRAETSAAAHGPVKRARRKARLPRL